MGAALGLVLRLLQVLGEQPHDLRELDLVHVEDLLHLGVGADHAAVRRVLQLVLLDVRPATGRAAKISIGARFMRRPRASTHNSLTAAGRESAGLPSSDCSGADSL